MAEQIIKEEPIPKQFKVLIANDEPMQLAMLAAIFERNDFSTTTAING